jgi:hypothetical protein
MFSLLNGVVGIDENKVFAVELWCRQRSESVLAAEFVLSAGKRIKFLLPNCGVGSEANHGLAADFMLSAANHVFDAELCCPHRIRCSVPNCVLRSESGVRCGICVVRSEYGFPC